MHFSPLGWYRVTATAFVKDRFIVLIQDIAPFAMKAELELDAFGTFLEVPYPFSGTRAPAKFCVVPSPLYYGDGRLSVAFPGVFRLARTKCAEFANFSMQKACPPRLPAFGARSDRAEREGQEGGQHEQAKR